MNRKRRLKLLLTVFALTLVMFLGYVSRSYAAAASITTQPKNVTVCVGSTATFSIVAAGTGTLKYQWQAAAPGSSTWKNSSAAGAKTAKLSITAQAAHNGFRFRCVVTDGNGKTTTSKAVTLTVKPKITTQPKSATISVGSSVTFTIAATGSGTLTYQWQSKAPSSDTWKNSIASSATTAKFVFKPQAAHQGYQFRCIVKDSKGNQTISNVVKVTLCNVPVTSTYFPDSVFRKYVSTNFDKDSNGKLSSSELLAVKEIDVNAKNIGDLKGVEYFTKLEHLDCGGDVIRTTVLCNTVSINSAVHKGNQIKSLNLSCNTELKYLNCSKNYLTKLDVSRNTKLETLICTGLLYCDSATLKGYDYRLKALDLSRNPSLKKLIVQSNQLTELDLRNNTKLETVDCGHNRIEFLYVANSPQLTSLRCNSNNLRSLNTTGNTKLTELICADNHLASLNLSKNTALKWIQCQFNDLKTLDTSMCKSLSYCACFSNNPEDNVLGYRKRLASYYGLSDADIKKMENIVDSCVSDSMNTIEKLKAIHDWVVLNTSYDYTYTPHTTTEVLNDHLAICGSYSEFYSAFLDMLGITNFYIVGTDHAWNAVRLDDGNFYYIDTTWDDSKQNDLTYGYFLIGLQSMSAETDHHIAINALSLSMEDYDWKAFIKDQY